MFFGTPSQGMDIKTLLPLVDGKPNEFFIRTLGPSTSILRDQMDDFRRIFEQMSFSVFWYYETMESPTACQVCTTFFSRVFARLTSYSVAMASGKWKDRSAG